MPPPKLDDENPPPKDDFDGAADDMPPIPKGDGEGAAIEPPKGDAPRADWPLPNGD